ncbi:MAG: S9 family peptidase [Candidatus Aquilonibacter sp.]
MLVRRALIALALCACALLALSSAISAKGLDYEDLRKIVGVDAPQLAPDGTHVVYVRSTIDWKDNRRDTELVLVDVHTGNARTITHDRIDVSEPRWSPDGTQLVYRAAPERDKPSQLYVLPMNGGDSLKVTDAPNGVMTYSWRPDSRAIAYVTPNDDPNKKAVDKHLDSVVITDQHYLTRTQAQTSHIWVVNADGTGAQRLTDGTWSVAGDISWSPDAKRIYYTRSPDALVLAHLNEQQTWVHDVAAKSDTQLVSGVSARGVLSHDGAALAVAIPRHTFFYLTNDLSVRSTTDGHELWNAKAIDRNIHAFTWLPHDAGLVVETADGLRNVAWILKPDGTARKIDLGNVDIVQANVAADGGIAFIGQRQDHYAELFYLASGASAPKALSDNNAWTANYQIAKVEPFEWTTDLGVKAVGALYYPIDYSAGKKYPLVMDIHGGPISTSTWDLGGIENGELDQVLATRGYFVFRPNYRGSDNLGDAFLMAIVGDMASGPGKDNLAAVDALRKTGMIDESRIFVSGWSGGGLQTSWLIGHANFWRAAVSGAAVNDQYEQAVLSDINEPFNQAFFPNVSPFTQAGRAAYDAESPITYVDAMKTPLLILSDTRDQRVPVPQAYALYHALKQRGVPVQFTAFPRAGHFPTDPVGQEQVFRAWVGWIERYSK